MIKYGSRLIKRPIYVCCSLLFCLNLKFIYSSTADSKYACENTNLTFSCTPQSGSSAWILTGFNGVSNTAQSALLLSAQYLGIFSTSDTTTDARSSNLNILKIMQNYTGATVQCRNNMVMTSTLANITVG